MPHIFQAINYVLVIFGSTFYLSLHTVLRFSFFLSFWGLFHPMPKWNGKHVLINLGNAHFTLHPVAQSASILNTIELNQLIRLNGNFFCVINRLVSIANQLLYQSSRTNKVSIRRNWRWNCNWMYWHDKWIDRLPTFRCKFWVYRMVHATLTAF